MMLSISYIFVVAVSSLQYTLQCEHSTCEVSIYQDHELVYAADLVQETQWSSKAIKVQVSGQSYAATPSSSSHFQSRASNPHFATAFIHFPSQTLIQGLFFTNTSTVIEFFPNGTHTFQPLRSRILSHAVETDLVLDLPEDEQQVWRQFVRMKKSTQTASSTSGESVLPFFPQCFPNDAFTHVFTLDVVYDYGLFHYLTNDIPVFNDKIQFALDNLLQLFAVGKLVFLSQLNVRLDLNRVIFGAQTDPVPLSRSNSDGSCVNALGAHAEMLTWNTQENAVETTGFRILVSKCFSGIVGTSYIGNACGSSNANVAVHSWLTVFHELGHAFGMSHSFENGQGLTGGIMDYGDGKYNNVVQFHPNKQSEVCPFLSYLQAECPFFTLAPVGSSCGDGVLVASEECECLEQGQTSCGQCVNCQVVGTVECSADTFVFRDVNTPSIAVVSDSTHLSHPECCTPLKRFSGPKSLCENGINVCSLGKCVALCSKYLSWNNPNCGFDSTGCNLGCIFNDKCRFDLEVTNDDNEIEFVGQVPFGTHCISENFDMLGTCAGAQCLSTASPNQPPYASVHPTPFPTPPTSRPTTLAPVVTKKPTTLAPSSTSPTKKPTTLAPVVTTKPTRLPTLLPTTLKPTMQPTSHTPTFPTTLEPTVQPTSHTPTFPTIPPTTETPSQANSTEGVDGADGAWSQESVPIVIGSVVGFASLLALAIAITIKRRRLRKAAALLIPIKEEPNMVVAARNPIYQQELKL